MHRKLILLRGVFLEVGRRPKGSLLHADSHPDGKSLHPRRPEAVPRPEQSRRDLHRLLRGQQGPNVLRPLPGARIVGRIRRRGKGLQAIRRELLQAVGAPLVESGREHSARRQVLHQEQSLGLLPRLEGLSHRSRLIKENGTHPRHNLDCIAIEMHSIA